MVKRLSENNGWVTLIGLLIALGIAAFFFMSYLAQEQINGPAADAAKEIGVDTSSMMSTYTGTVSRIDEINERNKNRGDELMQEIQDMQQY